MNTRPCHRIFQSPEEKRGRLIVDKVFMEVRLPVDKIIRRRKIQLSQGIGKTEVPYRMMAEPQYP